MNIAECLEDTAKRIPHQVGLQFEGKSYTFQELNRLSNRIANGLSLIGLKRERREYYRHGMLNSIQCT